MIKTTTPVSMAEGDRIVASGNENSSGFTVYAVRNATSGISSHSGIWGKVVLGLFFPLLGLFFCGLAALFLGAYSLLLYLGFVAYSIYLFYQAYMAASARRQVAVHPL